ncbi:MAG TPA: hypothetical protein VM427_07405 [Patescibacteria group bacterium]|nr:hypothetical protein [Patescibacteria group bacterium]
MTDEPRDPPGGHVETTGLDDALRDWLDQRGRVTDAELEVVRTRMASLPDRSAARRRSILGAAASIALLLGVAGLVVGRVPLIDDVGRAQPPDPAAFAGDPRLADCASGMADVAQAFEMARARWFPLHFPGWWRGAEELEVDDPALVVISGERPGQRYVPQRSGVPWDLSTPHPVIELCIAVGPPQDAVVHRYGQTWFERIVPVLSAADIERAGRMDPEVLADPANWHVPERLAPCGGLTDNVDYVFEATPLRDFGRYFPSVADTPVAAFDIDEPATVVILRARSSLRLQPVSVFQTQVGGSRRDVCVIFSQPNPLGEAVIVRDVDISDFHVRLEPLPDPTQPPTPTLSATPEPAPSWVGDIAGQLDCDGPVASIGDEVAADPSPDAFFPDHGGATAGEALSLFLGPTNMYASLPTEGFEEFHAEGHWASFAHVVGGRPKAIVVLTDRTRYAPGWSVVGLRACDASEFDPADPLTFPVTIWTDASGNPVSTATVRSAPGPGHCGWETAIFLHVRAETWFRDPGGVMGEWTETEFDAHAELPARAVDTGFRSGGFELWLDPGRDAYLVGSGGVERWPRSTLPDIGCM